MLRLEPLEPRCLLSGSPTGLFDPSPTLAPIDDVTLLSGSPLHLPLNATDPDGHAVTFTATSDNPQVATFIPEGNRSMRISVAGFGDMVFELFEGRVPRVTDHIIQLAEDDFYDGIIFHRVINGFMIQGGDPTGTGTGGSPLGEFDDQFNVDLQHNRGGLLSMAKSDDDTNDSQFFITEGPTRHLDFQHSIFGLLVEGEDVREAISNVPTDANDRPLTDVVMQSVDIFVDDENGVLMLKAPEGATGEADVTVTAVDEDGNTSSPQTFHVTVEPDTSDPSSNGNPFLADIPEIRTTIDTETTFQLTAIDAEGDPSFFLDEETLGFNSLPVPQPSDPDLDYLADFDTGLVTVTPTNGIVGVFPITVATGVSIDAIDYQVVPITIVPPAPTGVDLAAASDSGFDPTDNLTNRTTLDVTVSGVTSGALVRLYTGGELIGLAVAEGPSVVISTDNPGIFTEGLHSLAATQTREGMESDPSPALDVTIDVTPPPAIGGAAPAEAIPGVPYTFDAENPEEGQPGLAYSLAGAPAAMTIDPATGVVLWTPTAADVGPHALEVRATDGAGNVRTRAVDVTVLGELPADDDDYDVDEDSLLQVNAAEGVLGNDGDLHSGPLEASLVDGPANGTLALAQDGSFTYRPGADFHGADGFTYRASDGVRSSGVVTVALTVHSINDAPTAADDSYSAEEDGILVVDAANGILANDNDVDGDSLSAQIVAGPAHGTINLSGDGSLTYTPNPDFHGADGFTYKAGDGVLDSAEATVTITVDSVNDAPVAVGESYNVDEDNPLNVDAAAGVLANDSDPDGDPLTAQLVTSPGHGTLDLAGDGSFTYRPGADFHGADAFTYKASDGVLDSAEATVTITVNSVNDTPTAAADAYRVAEDGTLVVDGAVGVLANDNDVEGDSLAALLVTGPAHGTLDLAADGSLTYTPDPDFHGADGFTYKASDGALDSAEAAVTITVNSVNDAPTTIGESYNVDEDNPLNVDAASGVLANDGDPDGDPLTAQLVTAPGHGTLDLAGDGSFTYTPDPDFHGADGFTYKASDGALDSAETAVTVTIDPVDDAPLARGDAYGVVESGTLTVGAATGVLANDTDADGDPITARLATDVARGTLDLSGDGSFTYTPDPGFHGTDSFTYTAGDGVLDSAETTVTIRISAAPEAVDDSYAVDEDSSLNVDSTAGVLANDTDADGDPLTALLVTGPTHGTLDLAGDGSFTFAPDPNFHGADGFTYKASDGVLDSGETTVTIAVNPVNDAPTAAGDAYTMAEDGALVVNAGAGVLANDTDVDGDSLIARLATGPGHGTLDLAGDGSFTYSPDPDFHGADGFTYKANDGVLDSTETTVAITVDPVNDPPVAIGDSYAVDEDSPLNIDAPAGVLANDTDADGDPLTALLVTGPTHGTLDLAGDGSFIYTPDPDFHGADGFAYKASDGVLDSGETTVTIAVNPVNDTPTAAGDAYTMAEDGALVVNAAAGVLANDSDVDGDSLTAVMVARPAHGTLDLAGDGSLTYTPDPDFHGTDAFTYKANDGVLDSTETTVAITVDPVNDPPVAVADGYATNEDAALLIGADRGVLANDPDADGDPLTALLVTGPAHGTLDLAGDGSFTFAPDLDFHGADGFTYKATDGVLDSADATVTIAIAPVNDAPTAIVDGYGVLEDGVLAVDAPSGVLANDADVDGDRLTARLTDPADHGTLDLAGDGAFTFVPDPDFHGVDTFTYAARDGAAESAAATVTITVVPVNDAPEASADRYVLVQDTTLVVTAARGVLANDADPDGDPLTVRLTAGPEHGTLTLGDDGRFVYTPEVGFLGTDGFSYRAHDGSLFSPEATAAIIVTPAFFAEVPQSPFRSILAPEEGALVTIGPAVVDSGPEPRRLLSVNVEPLPGELLDTLLDTNTNNRYIEPSESPGRTGPAETGGGDAEQGGDQTGNAATSGDQTGNVTTGNTQTGAQAGGKTENSGADEPNDGGKTDNAKTGDGKTGPGKVENGPSAHQQTDAPNPDKAATGDLPAGESHEGDLQPGGSPAAAGKSDGDTSGGDLSPRADAGPASAAAVEAIWSRLAPEAFRRAVDTVMGKTDFAQGVLLAAVAAGGLHPTHPRVLILPRGQNSVNRRNKTRKVCRQDLP